MMHAFHTMFSLLAVISLSASAVLSANNTASATITKQYSTIYNYTTPGGLDPKVVAYSPVKIPFGDGVYPTASHNSTGPGDPTVIGIQILDTRELQPVYGVGCGVTDSASIALQDLKKVQPDTYATIMRLLWSQNQTELDEDGGAGLSFTRSPLGASDFGSTVYSYDDTADCSADTDLKLFTIEKAPKMWNTHKDIVAINPNVKTFWAPWSPPAWMKSEAQNCSMIGGSLLQKYEEVFAEYLSKSMDAISKKLGKMPFALSIQNEPLYTSPIYPGSKSTPDQMARVSNLVREKLNAKNLASIDLTAYDHNWDHPEFPLATFDNKSSFDSISWHCYAGSPEVQDQLIAAYPDKPHYFTECTAVTQQMDEPWKNLRTYTEKLLIGTIQHGSQNVIMWNCVLQTDDNGFTNPSLPETCKNCNAPILVYNKNLPTMPQMNAQGLFDVTPTQLSEPSASTMHQEDGDAAAPPSDKPIFKLTSEFAALAHLNRATRLQNHDESTAIRTGVSTTEQAIGWLDGERVKAQAYKIKLADGTYRYSLVVLQRNDYFLSGRFEPVDLVISFQGKVANVTGLPVGLHTFQWVA